MGVRITDLETVALYDSVSGFAFGPTFPSEEAAMDFLEYTEQEEDPRLWSDAKAEGLHSAWIEARGADFGYEPAGPPRTRYIVGADGVPYGPFGGS